MRVTEDKKLEREKRAHGLEALRGFVSLVMELKPIWVRMRERHGRVEGREILRVALEGSKKLDNLLCRYFLVGENDEGGEVKRRMVGMVMRGVMRRMNKAVEEQVRKRAEGAYIEIETARQQGDYLERIPLELRRYLPENILIETDEDGSISRITEAFGNKSKDIEYKIGQMEVLLSKWDKIGELVRGDYSSEDEKKRACAILVGVIMETGIRPGSEGTKSLGEKEGELVETYGATTLMGEHITFHRDGGASLDFEGKAATRNRALIEDRVLVRALRGLVEKRGEGLIFKLRGRGPVTQRELNEYIKKNIGVDVTATDFRKLKATKAVYESLREQERELLKSLKSFKGDAEENIKSRLILKLQGVLKKAVSAAKKSLNHMEDDVTIQHYLNPKIILGFLSKGGLSETLEEALLSDTPTLNFSPDVFMKKGSQGIGRLGVLISDLEARVSARR